MVQKSNVKCNSWYGMIGGAQDINLSGANWCMSSQTIKHEFLHAIGVYHMQSRTDRNDYIKIHWNNIWENGLKNFRLWEHSLTFDTEYDARSLMHYFWNSWAIDNSKPTITLRVSILKT